MKWVGGLAEWSVDGTTYLSVAFTWRLSEAVDRARFAIQCGQRVAVGGPALFTRRDFREHFDRLGCDVGGDYPDAVVQHNPLATIASRGCPVGCWFCIVPKMEGRDFTLLPDFPVRPVLCDNNLSALPADYQDHIVGRYKATGTPLLDANSGFEPKTFTDDVYARWKPINRGPWRFAYDESGERADVERVMRMLDAESPKKKRVYVLIGNEPQAACLARIQEVIAWGGEPHVQPYMKLNALDRRPYPRFDWTEQRLIDVARWANRRLWRYMTVDQYDRHYKRARHARQHAQEALAL
jgi:hypothetical protein